MKDEEKTIYLLVLVLVLLLGVAAGGAVEPPEQPLVNLFLFDTGIKDALNEITLQTGINIIPDSTVSGGVVTADLQDVPLEQALRLILIGGGVYIPQNRRFLPSWPARSPAATPLPNLLIPRLFFLQHMTAEQVLGGALPSFLTSYVKGGERGGGRMLTITAPPLELKRFYSS